MRITPDGVRYLAMGAGERAPLPFHLRWGLPWLCGQRPWAWQAFSWLGIGGTALLIACLGFQQGLSWEQSLFAGLLWLGLPSVRFLAGAPVLVDQLGMLLAVGAAFAAGFDVRVGVGLALLAGCVWEKAPIFAAAFAWHPALLLGLAAPIARRLLLEPGEVEATDRFRATLEHPFATGLQSHRGKWRDARTMALPWGAALAALFEPSLWWAAAVALAYGQLLLATDTVRLYQHAAPVVCIAAAAVIPEAWMLPVLVAHWLNPWAGSGV